MDTRTILLDVGGSYIKRPDGPDIPIPSDGSREAIATALHSAVVSILSGGHSRIGIAIPGPFNFKEGIFLMKHKFASVYGERFADIAGIPDGVEVKYIHDVNAVLEGAIRLMDLSSRNTALVTLGTGLGFSIAIKGQVRYSPSGSPADVLWNLPWKDGILEDFVGSRGVKRYWAEEGGDANDSAAVIANKADEGNPAAIRAYERMGDTLGEAVKGVLEEHGVDTLLFAGQVSKSLNLMESSLSKHLKDIVFVLAPKEAVFEGISSLFENN